MPRRHPASRRCCLPGLSPSWTIDECDPGGMGLLAEPRQSSFIGTGPDRLTPHRCRLFTWSRGHVVTWSRGHVGVTWIHVSPRGAEIDEQYPDPLGSDTFVVSSWSDRLETPASLARGPRPPDLLAQAAWPEGEPLALPREGDRDPPRPRCLPSVRSTSEGGGWPRPANQAKLTILRRVDLYPQIVPNLWIRVRACFILPRAPL